MQRTRKELHFNRLMDCYAERPATVNEMLSRSFAQSADQTAVVDGACRMSYAQLGVRAAALACELAERGVRSGDRVAVMLHNGVDAVVSVVAIARVGAVLVPLGTRLRRPEITYIFQDAEPVAVIYAAEFAAEMPASGPAAALRFECGSAAWTAMQVSGSVSKTSGSAAAETGTEDVFAILYTSGTTGKPKGAMLTHLNVVHSCLHWEEAHALQRGERTALCVPWSHVSGLCGVLLPFLYLGGTLITLADFKRRNFLELAQRERITHALMVPAMYGLCLLEPDLASFDLGRWRIGVYGGASMPEPTIARFAQAFPDLHMCNAYGATETTSPATIMPAGQGVAHADSIGQTVRCGDIRVMDDHGCELPAGEEGEMWIAGPMVVPGYWRNDESNASAFAGGYWKSGDIGAIDAQGYVRIADRKKDMINRGGFKVYPAEVESALTGLDGVVEAAVVGRPDSMLGEGVVAFLNAAPGALTEYAVRAWCAERMADYKVPGRVVIGQQPLPRNANGKIQKAELRQMAAALATREQKEDA